MAVSRLIFKWLQWWLRGKGVAEKALVVEVDVVVMVCQTKKIKVIVVLLVDEIIVK